MLSPSMAWAQAIIQTFEAGEDTSNWGSSWVAPGGFSENSPGFLDPSLGGANAGFASTQAGQEAHRDFRGNTVGLDIETTQYTVSTYLMLELSPGGAPASGHLYFLDGTFGDYTGNIRLTYDGGGLTAFEAADGSGWRSFGTLSGAAGKPLYLQLDIDPVVKTYTASVALVTPSGAIEQSESLSSLAITGNAINNRNNGQLFLHADTSAGFIEYQVDNIQVHPTAVPIPEPENTVIGSIAAIALFALIRQTTLLKSQRRKSE